MAVVRSDSVYFVTLKKLRQIIAAYIMLIVRFLRNKHLLQLQV